MLNKCKQMINKNKQSGNETYQTVVPPKRLISRIVDNLNKNGLKSVNGGDYNYHKVYQVVLGRWTDSNVDLARLEVLLEIADQEKRIVQLQEQLQNA